MEEYRLLEHDILSRLGTELKVRAFDEDTFIATYDTRGNFHLCDGCITSVVNIKPYLRPLSSMTEAEKEELHQEQTKDEKMFLDCINCAKNGDNSMRGKVCPHFASDWCDLHGFDHRGLIEKGLALCEVQ